MRGPPASMLWRRSSQRTPPHCRWALHTWAHTSLKCHAVEKTTVCTEQHVQRQTLSLVGAADDANDAMCLVRSAAQHRGRAHDKRGAVRGGAGAPERAGPQRADLHGPRVRGPAAPRGVECTRRLVYQGNPPHPPNPVHTHTHIHWALPKGFLQDEVPASNMDERARAMATNASPESQQPSRPPGSLPAVGLQPVL